MRICSFQPGATEIVFALGLEDHLVGVTARCDYPHGASSKPVLVHSVFEGSHHTKQRFENAEVRISYSSFVNSGNH